MPGPFNINDPNLKNFFADSGQEAAKPNQPMIVDLITLEKIYFQTIPQELDVQPNANFIDVPSAGRNVPNYHFTGGEDIIQFGISWYSGTGDYLGVIKRCKFLEALTRNDGNRRGIHPVKFIFGRLFIDSTFIVTAAPYRLGLFHRELDMAPSLAYQSITLKRISPTNPTRNQILNPYY